MEKMSLKRVSVVLCTYNGEKYIREQLESIVSQTYPIHELLIQDDCSTDATPLIIEEYKEKYPFIRFYRNKNNLGFNRNFWKAFEKVTGDYIAISDQDDIWVDTKIEVLVGCIGNYLMGKISMDRIFLCSFGNSSYLSSLSRLRAQAEETGWFYRVECSTEKNLSAFFRQEAADLLKQEVRGFGYWIWKPQILLQCLQQMEYGDILLYTDAGCHINEVGKNMFLAYIKEVKKHPSGFLVFGARKGSLERQYTKGDIFSYFGIQEDDDIYNSGQIHATTFFLRKDDHTQKVVECWKKVMMENRNLIDDSPSSTPNALDFKENRHDQSVFSILMKLNKAQIYPITHIWSYTWFFMGYYPIWAKRDRGETLRKYYPLKQYWKDFLFFVRNRVERL